MLGRFRLRSFQYEMALRGGGGRREGFFLFGREGISKFRIFLGFQQVLGIRYGVLSIVRGFLLRGFLGLGFVVIGFLQFYQLRFFLIVIQISVYFVSVIRGCLIYVGRRVVFVFYWEFESSISQCFGIYGVQFNLRSYSEVIREFILFLQFKEFYKLR